MKYKTLNDKILEADSLRDLAEQLWQMMMVPEPTLEEWMLNSARRALEWNGAVIRTGSPEDHVEDLIEVGLLSRLS